MKVTGKALRPFPVPEGEGRRIVEEGEEFEANLTQMRKWAETGKVKFDEEDQAGEKKASKASKSEKE